MAKEYRVFRPTYTQDGETRTSANYHVDFRDHLRRRQTLTAGPRESGAHKLAGRLLELVDCRRQSTQPNPRLQRWLDAIPSRLRERLGKMDLITVRAAELDKPLKQHLEGVKDDAGTVTEPGFQQAREAKGTRADSVSAVVRRIARVLEGCSFTFWQDLMQPGATTAAAVYLGQLRQNKKINGTSYNYHVRDLKSFCRWMAKRLEVGIAPLEDLESVDNAASDAGERRALTMEEMLWLIGTTDAATEPSKTGLSGEERALLYRFAFESGIRPNQIRQLIVADFDLEASPPIVTSQARYVKRRRKHVQVLTPGMAALLAERFKSKLPAAPAFRLPSPSHMAEMLRRDLAAARAAWIEEAGKDDKEWENRQRSDFLAAVNNEGQHAVFYSTRHGHGTALAAAGVPEKDIAASMHHASRTTTARYLHSDRKSAGEAIATFPDLSPPQRQVATGTNGAEPMPPRELKPAQGKKPCALPCAKDSTGLDAIGQSEKTGRAVKCVGTVENTDDSGKNAGTTSYGPLAELADAMDSKSIFRKEVSVRLR